MSYDNTNSGALFKNDKKGVETRPDYSGSINVGGVDYWLSAWIKEGKSGKFMSLAVKPKDKDKGKQEPNAYRKARDDGDDIPW